MSDGAELRKIATAARPAIISWLEAAEELAGFSDLCRTKDIEWSQVKALLKAEYQDAQDGGQRVQKIIDKADRASAYAEMLAGADIPKNISGKESRGSVECRDIPPSVRQADPDSRVAAPKALGIGAREAGVAPGPRDTDIDLTIPPFLDRRAPAWAS